MPRFFFSVHDGEDLPDRDGTDLPDLTAARICAVEMAGEMLKQDAERFWSGEEWRMDVTDQAGLILFTLAFVAFDAPSVGESRSKIQR